MTFAYEEETGVNQLHLVPSQLGTPRSRRERWAGHRVTLRQLAQGKLLSHLILRCWQSTQARMRGGLFGTLAGVCAAVGAAVGAGPVEDVVEGALAGEPVDTKSGGGIPWLEESIVAWPPLRRC